MNTGDVSNRDSAEEGDVARTTTPKQRVTWPKDGRVAFSSDGDIITVGNFAKEVDVAITSAGNLFIVSCHQKY